MPDYFFDSSAIVKIYAAEDGGLWTSHLVFETDKFNRPANFCVIADITRVEVSAALARRSRNARVLAGSLTQTLESFSEHVGTALMPVVITPNHIDSAVQIAIRQRLRGYDAVQLAVAVSLNTERTAAGLPPIIFVSADNELLAAALAAGLPVDNPNLHP